MCLYYNDKQITRTVNRKIDPQTFIVKLFENDSNEVNDGPSQQFFQNTRPVKNQDIDDNENADEEHDQLFSVENQTIHSAIIRIVVDEVPESIKAEIYEEVIKTIY